LSSSAGLLRSSSRLRQSVLVTGEQDVQAAAPEDVASLLRERIYGGIACLSTLLLLLRDPGDEPSAWPLVLDVVVATGSLWAASLLADVVSHLAAHGSAPRGAEAGRMFRTSGQILEAAVIPVALLVLSGFGVLMTERAIRAGVGGDARALRAARRAAHEAGVVEAPRARRGPDRAGGAGRCAQDPGALSVGMSA
jgi:hypothetical protein